MMKIVNDYELINNIDKMKEYDVIIFNFPFYMKTAQKMTCSYFKDIINIDNEDSLRKYVLNVINSNRRIIYKILITNEINNYILVFNDESIKYDFIKYVNELKNKYKLDFQL